MSCPGCDAGIPWVWLGGKDEGPTHQWDEHKTVCERYLADMATRPDAKPEFWCYPASEIPANKP